MATMLQPHSLRRNGPGKVGSNVVDGLQLTAASSIEALVEPLRMALASNLQRTVQLFREWDVDASGSVDRAEMARALRVLGLQVDERASNMLFNALDADGSGTVEYNELHALVRQRIDVAQQKKKRQRKAAPPRRPVHSLAEQDAATLAKDRLRRKLTENMQRTVDLFHAMDSDGSGAVDRAEFTEVVQRVVPGTNDATCAALFDAIDLDVSGYVEFTELFKALRRRASGVHHTGRATSTTRSAAVHLEQVPGRMGYGADLYHREHLRRSQEDVGEHSRSSQEHIATEVELASGLPPVPTLPRTVPARHRRVGRRMPLRARAEELPPIDTSRNDQRQPHAGLKWQWT